MHGKGRRNDRYQTPDWFFNELNSRFNFTVDAACTTEDKKCDLGFCIDTGHSGLDMSWKGHRVFCNPPFSKKREWMKKAHEEVQKNGCCVCVMLLPTNSMSSSFWFNYVYGFYYYEVLNKRLFYIDPETKKPAKEADSGTTVVYFMKRLSSKENTV